VDQEHTQIITSVHSIDAILDERVHCLEIAEGLGPARRHVVASAPAVLGRTPPSDVVLADSEVSRAHCRVVMSGEDMIVTDLNSTNGTYVEGVRISAPTVLPVGAILQLGRQRLKHEWRARRQIFESDQLDRDLENAASYVKAMLPPPTRHGPIRADYMYEPSAKLGGDAFGYGQLNDTQFVGYLIDVSGHGAGAAMHSVAIMNVLRQRTLPNTDMADPAQVLATLNALFQMQDHADMFFTIWYGVYDARSRRLDYASAGHHPAYLVDSDRNEALALRTPNGLIGARLGVAYKTASVAVPPGASLYVFSDGVFETVTIDGVQWGLSDFTSLILRPTVDGVSECERLYRAVRQAAAPGPLDDDFSLVVMTFD
jgi:serine phosphatase RsbU (regulator of sigma subunit)